MIVELALASLASYLAYRLVRSASDAPATTTAPGSSTPTEPTTPAPTDYPLATLAPRAPDAKTAARIRALGDALDRVWPEVTGKGALPAPTKLLLLAQAAAERTGYGQGWDGDMAGSFNVASYQVGSAPKETPYYRSVDHVDSSPQPDGSQKTYTTSFRFYLAGKTPDGKERTAQEAGAWDFVRSVTVGTFPALAPLLAGDLLWYGRVQYGNRYYQGFNLSPEGLTAYAPSVGRLVRGDVPPGVPPIRRAGETPEQVAGRIVFYSAAMARSLPEVAGALGLAAVPVRVGADLAQPWRPSYQASARKAVA